MNHFEIFLTEGQIFLTGQRENKTNKVLFHVGKVLNPSKEAQFSYTNHENERILTLFKAHSTVFCNFSDKKRALDRMIIHLDRCNAPVAKY